MENKPILSQSFTSMDYLNQEDNQNRPSRSIIDNPSSLGIFRSVKKRHVLAIYAFFGFFFAYSIRANLSVAIVDMAKMKHVNTYNSPTTTSQRNLLQNQSLNENNFTTQTPQDDKSVEQWSPVLQGYILASFFYGYIVTQLPAAYLTSKYGGKIFFGVGIGVCSFLSLLMPLAVYVGPTWLIILRVLQGVTQGFIFPSMHCLWSKWSPPSERTRLATFALSGSYIGSVCALSLGGVIGEMFNWQSIFYVFGVAGVIWSALFISFTHESPSIHKTISNDEKLFIETSISFNDISKIPWSSILKSSAVWAIVFAHFSENWGFYTMLTEMPTFFAEIMKYKIDKAGVLSSLPYLTMAIVLYISGYISDKLIEKKMTYTFVRKLFCCGGLVAQSVFMFIMIFSSNGTFLIIFVTLSIGFGGMAWSSFGVNHLDIGAGYANVLMSISNTFASLPGIISPILTGHLIEDQTKSEWNAVFIISAVIYLIGAIVFGIIGTGETQSWVFHTKELEITNTISNKLSKGNSSNFSLNETYIPSSDKHNEIDPTVTKYDATTKEINMPTTVRNE